MALLPFCSDLMGEWPVVGGGIQEQNEMGKTSCQKIWEGIHGLLSKIMMIGIGELYAQQSTAVAPFRRPPGTSLSIQTKKSCGSFLYYAAFGFLYCNNCSLYSVLASTLLLLRHRLIM